MSFGSHGQRTGDGDPLLLAAGELRGIGVALSARPTRSSSSRARSRAIAFDSLRTWTGASMMFSSDGHVREQVEVLEHHADVAALGGDFALAHLVQLVAVWR